MKKIPCYIFILMFVLITSSTSRGQSPLRLGLQSGLNIANQSWPSSLSSSSRLGISAAAIIEYRISSLMYLQGEARYIQKGSEIGGQVITDETGPEPIGEGTSHFNFNNLEFPVLLKVIFNSGKIKPYFLLGPNLAINISSKTTFTTRIFETGETNEVFSADIDDADSIELAFEIGGGGELQLSNNVSIGVTIRYLKGLNTVWRDSKSRGLLITVGTLFRI